MKKITLHTIIILIISIQSSFAQWCVPITAIPYNADMPGITHFVLNTIDRTSSDVEDYPHNNYVNTGMTTALEPGQTYSVSITFTIDPQICPNMNLRVWIDYNQDFQLDDVGETVISANNQLPGTYTSTFTVPMNVMPGTTRLRVTAKMTPSGFHTLPTPCDNPPDPAGYHGEIEDYTVIFNSPTGINAIPSVPTFNAFVTDNNISFNLNIADASKAEIKLMNATGQLVADVLPEQLLTSGNYSYNLNKNIYSIKPGIYFATLIYDNKKQVIKLLCE